MDYGPVRGRIRAHPLGATLVLSAIGYGLVVGTFVLELPYPSLSPEQINLLTHLVAVINASTVVLLVARWRAIRANQIDRHRLAMVGAFSLIMLFLVVYLVRVGGGGEKHIVGVSAPVYYLYLAMLAIHIILSIVAVPVVLYALLLGISHTPAELRRTAHARVGRVAAASWILSLVLGVVTYVMLNHIYSFEFA